MQPRPAKAVFGIGDIVFDPKQFFEDIKRDWQKVASKAAKRIIIAQIRSKILNPGGGNQGPAFVTNWQNFARRSQDDGRRIGELIAGKALLGTTTDPSKATACPHFAQNVARIVGARSPDEETAKTLSNYRIDSKQTFEEAMRCTLPKEATIEGKKYTTTEYVDKFREDMRYGGWDLYHELAQENNRVDTYLAQVQNQINTQTQRGEQSKLNDAMAGNGFLSLVNKVGQIKTPAGLVNATAHSIINSELDCFDSAETMAQLTQCAQDVILKQVENFRDISEDIFGDDQVGAPQASSDLQPEDCQDMCNQTADQTCTESKTASERSLCERQAFDDCIQSLNFCQN